MRKGTSGVWVTETENEIKIGYEDYGVSEFGGRNFECTYTLRAEDAAKFRNALRTAYSGTLKEMVCKAFGEEFHDVAFINFCNDFGIEYSKTTWSSGDMDWDWHL